MILSTFDDFFAVLSNQQRVKILRLLNQSGPHNVGDIATKLKIEQSAVSHSIKHLLDYHFVTVQQVGKERVYTINSDTITPLFALIEKHMQEYCNQGCGHHDSSN